MKFGLARTKKFKKSFKKLHLKDNDEAIYIDVVSKLLNGIALDKKYKDHFLKGNPERYMVIKIIKGSYYGRFSANPTRYQGKEGSSQYP